MALRIVLVDDDEKLAELLRVNFELDDRFELVGWAHNGLEGIELVREARPDAVLMDLNMPLMDGTAATRQILEHDPNACVIAFTASHDRHEPRPRSTPAPPPSWKSRSTPLPSSTPSNTTPAAARARAKTPPKPASSTGR